MRRPDGSVPPPSPCAVIPRNPDVRRSKGPGQNRTFAFGEKSGVNKRMDGFDTGIAHQELFPERPLDSCSEKNRKQDGRSAHPYRFPFRITLLKWTNICHHDFHFADMADMGWA